MFVNDFKCRECGRVFEEITEARVEVLACPKCGGRATVTFTKAPAYHVSVEDYLEQKRGHLHGKVKKSMEREAALKAAVNGARARGKSRGISRLGK